MKGTEKEERTILVHCPCGGSGEGEPGSSQEPGALELSGSAFPGAPAGSLIRIEQLGLELAPVTAGWHRTWWYLLCHNTSPSKCDPAKFFQLFSIALCKI